MHSVVTMTFGDQEYTLTPHWAMPEPYHVDKESLQVYHWSPQYSV